MSEAAGERGLPQWMQYTLEASLVPWQMGQLVSLMAAPLPPLSPLLRVGRGGPRYGRPFALVVDGCHADLVGLAVGQAASGGSADPDLVRAPATRAAPAVVGHVAPQGRLAHVRGGAPPLGRTWPGLPPELGFWSSCIGHTWPASLGRPAHRMRGARSIALREHGDHLRRWKIWGIIPV